MNRQIFLCCISSILVIHSIDYETAEKNITNVEDLEDEYEKAYDEGNEVNDEESPEREGRFFFNRRPIRFRRPLLSPRIASLFATIPTLFGLGAGLAWIVAHRDPISINITDIGSPTTNVTASITNTNTPTNTQTQTNTNTATNTNNDQDTITQSETNTNTNNANTNCVCVCDGVSCTCTNCG